MSKKKTITTWEPVLDRDVQHIWRCPYCENDTAVGPGFYEESGTPVCEGCEEDMAYVRTDVARRAAGG